MNMPCQPPLGSYLCDTTCSLGLSSGAFTVPPVCPFAAFSAHPPPLFPLWKLKPGLSMLPPGCLLSLQSPPSSSCVTSCLLGRWWRCPYWLFPQFALALLHHVVCLIFLIPKPDISCPRGLLPSLLTYRAVSAHNWYSVNCICCTGIQQSQAWPRRSAIPEAMQHTEGTLNLLKQELNWIRNGVTSLEKPARYSHWLDVSDRQLVFICLILVFLFLTYNNCAYSWGTMWYFDSCMHFVIIKSEQLAYPSP